MHSEQEIETRLSDLRRVYIESIPEQRLHIADQRIANPNHEPNLLITHVSAVEGFARSVAMHLHAQSKEELSEIYPRYKLRSPENLVTEVVKAKANTTPAELLGASDWKMFLYAVEFRHLLVHECTYLGQDITPDLIDACTKVLDAIVALDGTERDTSKT
jgi:hypothetical protein